MASLVVTRKFIKNYIIKISEGKCNFNEKNNYANHFDERHVLLWYKIIRGKEIDISSVENMIRPMQTFTFQPKHVFYKNLHYPIQERLSLLISKRVSHNFAEKLLAMLICLWCTLTCLCTVISRSLLRRLFWCLHGW